MATRLVEPKTVEEAKQNRVSKAIHATKRGAKFVEDDNWDTQLYRPGIKLDLWRARLVTESFRQTDGQAHVIRRAKAIAHYYENVPPYISPGQRFSISGTSCIDTVPFCPEKYHKWVKRAIHDQTMRKMFNDEERVEMDGILDWWAGKTVWDKERAAIPDWLERYHQWDGTFMWAQYDQGPGQRLKEIWQGTNARVKTAEDKLADLERTLPPDYVNQKTNLEAMVIALKGANNFVHRTAEHCRELAKQTDDAERKAELEKMAEINDWVPANPPRNFWESLQHVMTVICMCGREEAGISGLPPDRFDQAYLPYWEKSKAEGMTYEEGVELCKWWLLKHAECGSIQSPMVAQAYGGQQRGGLMCVGGVDSNGKDSTNDLTYMILDAFIAMKNLNEPQIDIRIHPGTPKELVFKALELIKMGTGYPSMFNDNVLIPLMQRYGWSLEESRNYYMPFCVTHRIPGEHGSVEGWFGWQNWPKILLWALNKGIDPETGEQKGAVTTDPRQWTGYEDMMEAYLVQLRFFSDKQMQLHNIMHQTNRDQMRKPFSAAFCVDSLEHGVTGQEWSACPIQGCTTWPVVGPTNAINSMAAIKKWVFDEKKIKIENLIDALHKNWEGYEDMRQLMMQAPKFGNDDDYVDTIAQEVQVKSVAVLESHKDYWGVNTTVNGSNASAIYGFSLDTDATPDGRFKGDMIADGTISPQIGTDTRGPLAVLRSASKIDVPNTYSHLLNMKLSPALVEGDVGKEAFYNLLMTWCQLGISHIQFNVVKKETLLDAQSHPENYPNLLVRVAGFSAYFVDLSKGMQDGIIARTEQQTMG